MQANSIIDVTKSFVQSILRNAEGGHDWFHTSRVYRNALHISEHEEVNELVVALAALLHDIADSKFHNGDERIGPRLAREFLLKNNVDSEVIEHVSKIIENMSFKNSIDGSSSFSSIELKVVQDADRLDAIGAIGIARCFNYGGFKNRSIYNPEIEPNLTMTKAEYKAAKGPTINHFYEKLLLLKDMMNTKTGRRIAHERHEFMLQFLKQFYAEWNGNK
ncbi:HD domain-containing protein [Winogradskyella aurantia]|uniref:Phosphohydrolase n=1 Tax=Winogradskyella aurantia TaxID=1915063 RepID=A0A265UZL0_9FLAO|nr:HD domain-containing protein [Winogradskyella aurantia]OZV70740.1 phosphohydrolase [Winogradskyella aurantia]